jgi:hypothetical protein
MDGGQPGGTGRSDGKDGQLQHRSDDLDKQHDFTNTNSGPNKIGKKGEKNRKWCHKDFQHIEEVASKAEDGSTAEPTRSNNKHPDGFGAASDDSVHFKRFEYPQAVEMARKLMPPGLDYNVSPDAPEYVPRTTRNGANVAESPTSLEDDHLSTHATEEAALEPAIAEKAEEDWMLHLLPLLA